MLLVGVGCGAGTVWFALGGHYDITHGVGAGATWVAGAALMVASFGAFMASVGLPLLSLAAGLGIAVWSLCHWLGLCRHWDVMNASTATSILATAIALVLCGPWRTMRQRPIVVVLIGASVFALAVLGVTLHLIGDSTKNLATAIWSMPPLVALGLALTGLAVSGIGWRMQEQLRPTIHDLRTSILIAATWGCVLLTVLSAALATAPLYERLQQNHHDDLRQEARHRAIEIEQYMDRIRTLAGQIASRTRARELLIEHRASRIAPEMVTRQTRAILADAMASSADLLAIRRLTADGNIIVTLAAGNRSIPWPEVDTDTTTLRWIGPWEVNDERLLLVVSPIVDRDDGKLGCDLLVVRMNEVERLLMAPSDFGRSATVSMVVLDPSGVKVGRVARRSTKKVIWSNEDDSPIVRQSLVQGDVTDTSLIATPASSMLAAAQMIRGSNWAVVVEVNAAELYGVEAARISLIFCVVLLLAGLGALTALRLVRPLTGRIGDAANSLEQRARVADEELRATQYRLRVAREIQFQLFPVEAPIVPGYQIAGASFAVETVDGDYYDYIPISDGSLLVAVGDACGHGLGASLLMAQTRAALWALTRTAQDPGVVLTQTNDVLSQSMPASRFVTLSLLRIDPALHRMTYAAAGHPDAMIFSADGRLRQRVASNGLPLGVSAREAYAASVLPPLEPGDTIVMVTDGLTESRNAENKALGTQQFEKIVSDHIHDSPHGLIESIYDHVMRHGNDTMEDDVTIVVIRRDGEPTRA